jgi:hypothetical protein
LKWSGLSLAEWIQGILTLSSSFGLNCADSHFFQIFAAVLCDLLWYYRNQAVHKGVIPAVAFIAAHINRVALEHHIAWSSKLHHVKEAWSKLATGFCKVNFDTAIHGAFSIQAAVCRNSEGQIIKAITQVSPPCSPVYGEALAAKLASFILEGDSHIVILPLNNHALSIDWHIDHVISDTIASFQVSSNWEVRKINRSANFCAHYATYRAAARVIPGCIPYFSPPSSIQIYSGKDPPPLLPPL